MSTLVLPSIINTCSKQNNNEIRHLCERELQISPSIIEITRNYSVIEADGLKYCLTCNEKKVPGDYEYVVLVNKRPTQDVISNGILQCKRWIKHPKMVSATTDEIIRSWRNDFSFIEENVKDNILGLRTPQICAIHCVLSHLKIADEIGTVVLPTGTGKTEVMISVLVAHQCGKLLVCVPSDNLREQLFSKFIFLGLLKQFKIVGSRSLYPRVGIVRSKFKSIQELDTFAMGCNVIVTTMHILSGMAVELQAKLAKGCSHVFIDEAHHIKAESWSTVVTQFPKQKVVQFTATPFRNDQKRLDGKIIYKFPLKKAQEGGYFTKIEFLPIREYDDSKSDQIIADKAVAKLKENIGKGFKHILMARCKNQTRAAEVFEYYKKHQQLSPVLLHCKVPNRKKILEDIRNKTHGIIVCVDMLGEGFDLPELKIAAFHDIRKSLPVTLQFAGRFTRTKYDADLGNACFIANLANVDVIEELDELYAQDSDWNSLLPVLSDKQIKAEFSFQEIISGFKNLNASSMPLQNLKPALSTVVYKSDHIKWYPDNFKAGLPDPNKYLHLFHDINSEKNILIIIYAIQSEIEWGNFKDTTQLEWHLIIAFWEPKNKLLFIHGSDKSSLYTELANSLVGKNSKIINKMDVFKAFHNLSRVTLQNVGMKEFLGKAIRFRLSAGADVGPALSVAETQRGQKAFVFGIGYEHGQKVSLGCSYKGRIWSHVKGDLNQLITWCTGLGNKLSNNSADPNQILRETLIPELITSRPQQQPFCIAWPVEVYTESETRHIFSIDGRKYDLSRCELQLVSASTTGALKFSVVTDNETVEFEIRLFAENENGTITPNYKVNGIHKKNVQVTVGSKTFPADRFFYDYPPTIWFVDGSSLTGNEYVQLKQAMRPYPKDRLVVWDWSGVDLTKESQGVLPPKTDSIQYKVVQNLLKDDVDIIYDDDYSGEIADVITIKQLSDKLLVKFYHLKYAKKGLVSNMIENLYEVCGQTQKSIHWKHKASNDLINHLLRREPKR
ncbi:MAG: hypothetical protein A2Y12_15545 [Planctomycetes bacterium GWF2_42_9]|nr:MAG: hypothetical protein A2Y12_15545 [Planctomycetes bacterium GWF2_42_9]